MFTKIKLYKKLIGRHLIVSATCASTELVVFTLINNLTQALYSAYILAFITATSLGFMLHRIYTFQAKDNVKKRASLFIIQAVVVLLIGISLFRLLLIIISNVYIAKCTQLMLTFCINIFVGKKITFKKD